MIVYLFLISSLNYLTMCVTCMKFIRVINYDYNNTQMNIIPIICSYLPDKMSSDDDSMVSIPEKTISKAKEKAPVKRRKFSRDPRLGTAERTRQWLAEIACVRLLFVSYSFLL
ncbi:hypothetical protein RND81_09G124700 [Saponaria officinalis]|uniref:Uncharacterized protein n=1 Tax=Saponaria officinalis TaxID=3572 RepID=A0AAW1IK03_SAPOF